MTITEVSQKYVISADTLRYYERIGLIPTVTRSASGVRDYQEEDLNWVNFVKCMRGAGLSIEVLVEYVSLFQKGDKTLQARKDLLIEQRRQLVKKMEDMQETLSRLNYKIDNYDEKIAKGDKKLRIRKKTGK